MPPRLILLFIASLVMVHGAGATGNPKNAPDPQSPPTITGTAQEGLALTTTDGVWSGAGAQLQFAYQWQRCTSATACASILSARAKTYVPVAADVTYRLRVIVTATNKFGTASSTSVLTEIVAPRPLTGGGASPPPPPSTGTAPANTSAPLISGTTLVGSNLTSSSGSWSGTTPMTYSYQWRRCDSTGAACADIAGATSASFTLTSTDAGKTLRVRMTAQNVYGSSSATSVASAVVASSTSTAPPPPSGTISFTGDWETGNISQWTWGAQCANYGGTSVPGIDRGNLYLVNSPVSQGVYGSRFDVPASSNRTACEVLRKRTMNLGADEYYGLDVRFPSDWQEPSPHGWGMAIGQFNYQGIWGTPVGLFAHRDHIKLILYSGYCRDVYSSDPGCTYQNGIGGNLPHSYAIPASRFAAGVWHQLVLHVRWTTANDGIIEVWHRRRGETTWAKTVALSGYPTVQWKDGYMPQAANGSVDKIGAYRGAATFSTSVWHDAFVIGTSFETVAGRLSYGPAGSS